MVVRLYDGAVGPTYLAQAQASASLNAAQQLAFSADLAPAEAGRHSGHVRVSGSIPLRPPLLAPAGTHRRTQVVTNSIGSELRHTVGVFGRRGALQARRHSGHDRMSGSIPCAPVPAPAGVNLRNCRAS